MGANTDAAKRAFAIQWSHDATMNTLYWGIVYEYTEIDADDGTFIVDLPRLQQKCVLMRAHYTTMKTKAILVQMMNDAPAWWGRQAMNTSTDEVRSETYMEIMRSIALKFDENGRNVLGGPEDAGEELDDGAIEISAGEIILIPAALGAKRAAAHTAACEAFKNHYKDLRNWGTSADFTNSLVKLHLSVPGSTPFPQYHGRLEKKPPKKKQTVINEAPPAVMATARLVMEVIMDMLGNKRPHKQVRLQRVANEMAHLTLCWYDRHVPRHGDEPHFDGPKDKVINLNVSEEGLFVLTSMIYEDARARAVYLFPGDLLSFTGSVRYVFLHAVYRLLPGQPSDWIQGLNGDNIHLARSIFSFRTGNCPEAGLRAHYDALLLDPEEDGSTFPSKYRPPNCPSCQAATAGQGQHQEQVHRWQDTRHSG